MMISNRSAIELSPVPPTQQRVGAREWRPYSTGADLFLVSSNKAQLPSLSNYTHPTVIIDGWRFCR